MAYESDILWRRGRQSNMRILIYGAGVIGSLYAVLFSNAGYDVSIYARGYRLEKLRENGLLYLENKRIKKARVKLCSKLSDTDIYDFSTDKKSLKKWEIELGLQHKELDLDWNEPVPEELWPKVSSYCDNDVYATEAVFEHLHDEFVAREILADIAGMSVNTSTNALTTKIIFEGETWRYEHLVKIGSLIESPALYGNLTAVENLMIHTRLMGISKERIYEVLELVDLSDTGGKTAAHFSMGMKQRLGIAIALLGNPQLLILDEPLQGLDGMNRKLVKHFIEQLVNNSQTQLLFVSHQDQDAPNCITHVFEFIPQGDGYVYKQSAV